MLGATTGSPAPPPPHKMLLGPAKLARIKAARGDCLSKAPEVFEEAGVHHVRFRLWGDVALLMAGGWQRKLAKGERQVFEDPLLNMQREDSGSWRMTLDNFFCMCKERRIFLRLRAHQVADARPRLERLIQDAADLCETDATSLLLRKLGDGTATTATGTVFDTLGDQCLPPCLGLQTTPAEYEARFKNDMRFFINRVCSELVNRGQVKLKDEILAQYKRIGNAYVAASAAPQRRNSLNKAEDRFRQMSTLGGKRPPACSNCPVDSCAAECAPEGMELFHGIGPVDILIRLAEEYAAEQRSIEAAMAEVDAADELTSPAGTP